MRPQQAGKKRQRLTLYDVPESVTDSYGQPSLAATAIGTFWAEVIPLQGREAFNVKQTWSTATHQIKLRWLGSAIPATPGNQAREIIPRMKFIQPSTGSVFNVINANNTETRNREWLCVCEEHQGATT